MSDTTTEAEAQAADATQSDAQSAAADDFDKERAMATIQKLRSFEKDAKAKLKRLEELEAKEREQTDKELGEAERLRKQLADLQATHAAAADRARRAELLNAARVEADKLSLALHPGALEEQVRLGAFEGLEMADDGEVKGLSKHLKELVAAKPWLLKPAAASADLDGTTRGKTSKADEDAAKAAERRNRWGIRSGA